MGGACVFMASKPLSSDEANDLMKQLGISETSPRSKERASKKAGTSNETSVASLLSELYRSDIGRRPPHLSHHS